MNVLFRSRTRKMIFKYSLESFSIMSVQHRVCSLIGHLEYGKLSKLIPKERMFTRKTVDANGGKTPCPSLAKKLGASRYGLFMEKIIENIIFGKNLTTTVSYLPEDLQKYFKPDSFLELSKVLLSENINYVQPQAEIWDKKAGIVGHPDLLSTDTVYDIKTTGRFGRMRTSTILQLLSYFCLCQRLGLTVTKVGLILPLQLKVVTYDLSNWRWEPFYDELQATIRCKENKEKLWDMSVAQALEFRHLTPHVGRHCHKKDLISIITGEHLPATQFFLSGNSSLEVVFADSFANDLKKAISSSSTRVFIHSPYSINLSLTGNYEKEGKNDTEINKIFGVTSGGYMLNCLTKILDFGEQNGIEGVVVHCGRTCGSDVDISVENMRKSVVKCVRMTRNQKCKLLIETSAKQGGELLSSPVDLANFYNSLPEDVVKHVGICVDTCHVFSAGYEPFPFMVSLLGEGIPIDLIHFNDSLLPQGCCRDRHAPIGSGYMGYQNLIDVLKYATQHYIPLVSE